LALAFPLPQRSGVVNTQLQQDRGDGSVEAGQVGVYPLHRHEGEGGEDVALRTAADEEAVVGVGGGDRWRG